MAEEYVQGTFANMLGETASNPASDQEAHSVLVPPGSQFSAEVPQFDMSDLVIPRLRLAQGLTPEVQTGAAKPGQWLLAGFEPQEKVEFVPVLFSRSRRYRDAEGTTLCEAKDATTGVGDPGGRCEQCPHNKWTNKGEQRIPPACDFAYTYIGYSLTHQAPAMLEFRRTALSAGRVINTMIMNFRGMSRFSVILSAKQEQRGRRSWHTPVVSSSGRTVEAIQKEMASANMLGPVPDTSEEAPPWLESEES